MLLGIFRVRGNGLRECSINDAGKLSRNAAVGSDIWFRAMVLPAYRIYLVYRPAA
jgi:hypothetical protein